MVSKGDLEKLGFKGEENDMYLVLPNGDSSELHIEKEMSNEQNILFTRGNANGVPGKDFDFVYAGKAKSAYQIQQLIKLLTE